MSANLDSLNAALDELNGYATEVIQAQPLLTSWRAQVNEAKTVGSKSLTVTEDVQKTYDEFFRLLDILDSQDLLVHKWLATANVSSAVHEGVRAGAGELVEALKNLIAVETMGDSANPANVNTDDGVVQDARNRVTRAIIGANAWPQKLAAEEATAKLKLGGTVQAVGARAPSADAEGGVVKDAIGDSGLELVAVGALIVGVIALVKMRR